MIRIEAYAVICENDCIADANGAMPPDLKNEAEWAFFQAGLDKADIIVLGRKSHEITPNPMNRRRLVLSAQVARAEWADERTVIWNPEGLSLQAVLEMFEGDVSTVAVTGGKRVFDYFLEHFSGYDRFHLSRMKGVYLKGGVKLFSALDAGGATPESLLTANGYVAGAYRALDEQASVVTWQQAH